MFKIKYVPPAKAEGQTKENYGVFPPGMDPPAPFLMYSASPELLTIGVQNLKYYLSHPRLTVPLLAAARYMAASAFGFRYCIDFNSALLGKMGADQEGVAALLGDLDQAPFEAGEIVLLKLLDKVIKAPETVTEADMQACRDAGWLDSDILDICQHAANLQIAGRLMTAFAA